MQCEDLYELISCLLPEVTASPAQHCTYSIFGTKLSWVRPILFAILLSFLYCVVKGGDHDAIGYVFLRTVGAEIDGPGLCFVLLVGNANKQAPISGQLTDCKVWSKAFKAIATCIFRAPRC